MYIGFSSLSAFDYCGLVGQPFSNITVGFDADELSTVVFASSADETVTNPDTATDGGFVTSTVTFYTPVGSAALNTKDLERNCSTILGYNYVPGNPSNAIDRSRTFKPSNTFHATMQFFITQLSLLTFSLSTADPCHPTIVIPDRVRSLDPAWASCITDGFGG